MHIMFTISWNLDTVKIGSQFMKVILIIIEGIKGAGQVALFAEHNDIKGVWQISCSGALHLKPTSWPLYHKRKWYIPIHAPCI